MLQGVPKRASLTGCHGTVAEKTPCGDRTNPSCSYGRPRSRWSLPPRLVLLILGAAAGAAGVIYVQEKHLPPRLSAGLHRTAQRLRAGRDAERKQLKADLAAHAEAAGAQADGKKLGEDLAAGRSGSEKLRQDLDFMVDALPADPRGGVVEVCRRCSAKAARLAYEVALTRSGGGNKPMARCCRSASAAWRQRRRDARAGQAAAAEPSPLRDRAARLALPEGFRASQATITVLDRPDGRQHAGMRVPRL